MYATLDDARVALSDWLEEAEHPDPAPVLEVLLAALIPAIGFVPSTAVTDPKPGLLKRLFDGGETPVSQSPGGTRIGGVPDVGPGFEWPIREKPADLDAFAYEGASKDDHIARYAGRDFPMQFIAQIDLAEATALDGGWPLPAQGRLLVFYDLAAGPWHSGTAVMRIIHDTRPSASLSPAEPPAAFAEMKEIEREATLTAPNDYGLTQEELLKYLPDFVHPAQAMTLRPMLQIPPSYSLELEANAPLKAMLDAPGPSGDSLNDIGFYDLVDEFRGQHFLFGAPVPEQDDPRYDAVETTEQGAAIRRRHADHWQAAFAEIKPLAPEWTLLLQVDVADLQQQPAEGTVYFLIRKPDLAAARFDQTVAIYQQT